MESTTPTQTASWLQRLKEESWEAELLVSAVAIFGSFQLFAAVDWTVFSFKIESSVLLCAIDWVT